MPSPPLAAAWGARPEELTAVTPADAVIPDADEHWVRAIDVTAPAALVWRWLCQMRVAPYSYDTLDSFARQSPQELTPGLDELEVGQPVMTIFRLASFVRDEHLTIRGTSPVLDLAIAYVIEPTSADESRLAMHVLPRLRGLARNPAGHAALTLLRAGDLVMARRQLLNFRALAERDARR